MTINTTIDAVNISEAAYHLWLGAGQPHGRDREFWFTAEAQLTAGAVKQKRPRTAAKSSEKPARTATRTKTAPKRKTPAKA